MVWLQAVVEFLKGSAPLLLSGGFGATAAWWLFQAFGDKWLAARFDKRLEALRHAQQKELEELRFRINALLDRATKLHQREFEVLPEICN